MPDAARGWDEPREPPPVAVDGRRPTSGRLRLRAAARLGDRRAAAAVHEADALTLVRELARRVEPLPADHALVLVRRRAGVRVARVADVIEVEVGLIRVGDERTVVDAVRHAVVVVV